MLYQNLYLKFRVNIENTEYRTDGCPGAVTSASVLTELQGDKETIQGSPRIFPPTSGFDKNPSVLSSLTFHSIAIL